MIVYCRGKKNLYAFKSIKGIPKSRIDEFDKMAENYFQIPWSNGFRHTFKNLFGYFVEYKYRYGFGDFVNEKVIEILQAKVKIDDNVWFEVVDGNAFVTNDTPKEDDGFNLKVGDVIEVADGCVRFIGTIKEFYPTGIRITYKHGGGEILYSGDKKNIKILEKHEPKMEQNYVIVANGVTVLTYDQAIAEAKEYCKVKNSTVTIYKAVADVVQEVQAVVREY